MNKIQKWLILLCFNLLAASTFSLLVPESIKAQGVSWQQKAASFVPTHQTDFASESFQAALRQFAATGANHVSLIIPIYQPNEYATTIYRGWNTPTDESLISGINYAHSLGLQVTLKIHAENEDGRWRAYINPSDRTAWFANYGNWLNHYASIAQNNGVAQLMIGAELYNMTSSKTNPTNTQNWLNLIAGVRDRFSGSVAYSAQRTSGWYDEFNEIEFWGALDYLGLSAYYAMAPDKTNPTVDDFTQSWQAALDQYIYPVFQKYQLPVLFTEIGYRSINEANKEPWSYDYAGAPNMQLQADLYQALFQFWQNIDWMAGIHIWDWLTNPNAGGPNDQGYTPQNKTAEQTITSWFSGAGQPAPSPTPAPSPSPPPGQQTFTFTASQNPLAVSAAATQALNDVIVDIEIYNSAGQQVHQSFYEHQNLSSTSTPYTLNQVLTPGTYRIAIGVFAANWSSLHHWENNVSTFTVNTNQPSPTPTPTPAPSPATTPSPTPTPLPAGDGEVLSTVWEFSLPDGGSTEKQQSVDPQILQGKTHLNITYNLHGTCLLSGDASAVIFNQNGSWRFISLADYGQNCFDGNQTVSIPLANFPGLDLNQNVGPFQIRFWLPEQYSIIVTGVQLTSSSSSPTPTPSPTASPSPSPTTPPTTPEEVNLEVWWPTDGASLSGTQPFKAIISGLSLPDYKMYWQVDDGQLVEMHDSYQEFPHKESLVDVSSWHWRNSGPYTLKFVAKNQAGQIIKERTINININ